MRKLRKRVLITVAATVVGALCGVLAGYVIGRALTLRHAQARLQPYADRIKSEGEVAAVDARKMLGVISASPYPFCSDQEIAWIRKLIFQSEYLKEGGRMRGGQLECSATLGRPDKPLAEFKPDFSQANGDRLYRNLEVFRIPNQAVITIQLGDSFVVYNPWNLKDLGSTSMHFTVTEQDAATNRTGRLVGELPEAANWILTHEGSFTQDGRMYFTRCSARFNACFTTYATFQEALQANRAEFTAYVVLGSVSGAFFGFVISLLYRRRRSLAQQLRRSIARDDLTVVYQPIVDLATRRIVGAEALVRWTEEEGLKVSPEVFVRIAEERGFVGEITELVVRHSLRDFAGTLIRRPGFHLSINVTAADLADAKFLPMLEGTVEREKVPSKSITLELTESSIVRHNLMVEAIQQLREKGHRVHIDDFGTGYSSLSYLHDLSIDAIKIDKSFTRSIGTEAVTVSILPQILSMAQALSLAVIVEGIETEEQAEYFSKLDRPILAQGWFFGRPVSAEDFQQLLSEEEKKAAAVTAPS